MPPYNKGSTMISTSVAEDIIQSKQKTPLLFNQIAHRYDFLNRLLSLRLDVLWRKALAKQFEKNRSFTILDLATGTGDVLLSLCQNGVQVKSGIGLDLSEGMIEIARKKIGGSPFAKKLSLEIGDAANILKANDSFDAVTMSFGIRMSSILSLASDSGAANSTDACRPGRGFSASSRKSRPGQLFSRCWWMTCASSQYRTSN